MSYRPQRMTAMKLNDLGEENMAYKQGDSSNSTNETSDAEKEKPRLVSVTSPSGNGSPQENGTSTSPAVENNKTTPEKKLRFSELRQTPADGESFKSSMKISTADLAESMGTSVGNVDKIRDILFGGQMRDYEKRFKRLEERFSQDQMNFREDIVQRLHQLEERLQGEIDTLDGKTKTDRQERVQVQQDLESEIKGLKNELNTRLTQLDEQFSKDIKNLRQQMLNKFQELGLQLRQQNDNLTNLLNQEVAQLQEDKVNRSDLATFLNEMAVRLTRNYEASSDLNQI
jgi:DNA repair exonuclease SbcCD ATPase subunit